MTASSEFVANDPFNMLIVVYLMFNIIQQNHENWYSNDMDENKVPVLLNFYL